MWGEGGWLALMKLKGALPQPLFLGTALVSCREGDGHNTSSVV